MISMDFCCNRQQKRTRAPCRAPCVHRACTVRAPSCTVSKPGPECDVIVWHYRGRHFRSRVRLSVLRREPGRPCRLKGGALHLEPVARMAHSSTPSRPRCVVGWSAGRTHGRECGQHHSSGPTSDSRLEHVKHDDDYSARVCPVGWAAGMAAGTYHIANRGVK